MSMKVCKRCGSNHIKKSTEPSIWGDLADKFNITVFECRDCGYKWDVISKWK